MVKKICAELNNFVDLKSTLLTVVKYLQQLTGCEAISIRLHDGDDYPYYIYQGFPESFIKKETYLCARNGQGETIIDAEGNPVLACMCGKIIRGQTDPLEPHFTLGGSFYSNSLTILAAKPANIDPNSHSRGYCRIAGYESLALVPIRCRDEIIGLIQINDRQINLFTADLIEYLEMVASQIGLAIQNSMSYTQLKAAYEEINTLRGLIPICCHCKRIRDDNGYWEAVEQYISRHVPSEFTHDICPDCMQKHYPEIELSLDFD